MLVGLMLVGGANSRAQIDPYPRRLIQLGYDQSLSGQGPQSLYAYYYYNNPAFWRPNLALRLAVAPVYFDGEMGFRRLLSPHTDVGLGINGGGYGENYYEVRQGHYFKDESFNGHGGGVTLNLYHRVNPARSIPIHLVVQGGAHFWTYSAADKTAAQFQLPADRASTFLRTGLRFAGKEPMLYSDLALEVSLWYERQWRGDAGPYGFARDRLVEPTTDLYWLYAGLNYAWTNTGDQFTLELTVGGSADADRFSAWRLGGVLPLAAEFPLTLPGYYYQEISAKRFGHLSAAYIFPLAADHRWQLRLGAAGAYVDYLPGLEQPGHWHTGLGPSLSFTSRSEVWRVVLRYGYGLNARR
ncbi:MAG TPA: hypothetical protein VL527_10300, partial [Dongiaceae bacterium]|nr:hypothetical protein [Dongiaceae bacterium]